MKHIILITLTFLTFASTAQIDTIKINFAKRTLSMDSVNKIRRGQFYQVIVEDVNLNAYKISINSKDTTLTPPIDPSSILAFNTNGIFSLLSTMVSTATANLIEGKPVNTNIRNKKPKTPNNGGIPANIIPENEDSIRLVKLFEIEKSVIAAQSNLWKLKFDIDQYSTELEIDFMEAMEADIKAIDSLSISFFREKVENFYSEFSAIHESLINLKLSLVEFKSNLTKIDTTIAKVMAALDSNLDTLLKATDLGLSLVSAEKVKQKSAVIVAYMNNKTATYTSLPIQFTKERTNLSIAIAPINANSGLSSYSTSLTFPTYRPWYYSVGLGMYYSTMRDDAYSTIGTSVSDTSNSFCLVQETTADGEYGTSMGFRFGYRFTKRGFVGVHGLVGTGVSFTKNVRPRLLLGGGVSFGDQHRLAVDFGFITGYSDRLSNAFTTTGTYSENPSNPVISTLQKAGFISVGYIFAF